MNSRKDAWFTAPNGSQMWHRWVISIEIGHAERTLNPNVAWSISAEHTLANWGEYWTEYLTKSTHQELDAAKNQLEEILKLILEQMSKYDASIPSDDSASIEENTFRILGLTADEWNALPPNARYHLIADAKKRSLRQEFSEQGER